MITVRNPSLEDPVGALPKSATALHVVVYSTGPTCQRCRLTHECLDAAGIPHVVTDLTDETNAAAREYVTDDLGYTQAPVVVVDDHDHWSGFRPDLIKRLAERIAEVSVHD